MEAFLGIDPGAKGYLCLLVPEIRDIHFHPNPTSWYEIEKCEDWVELTLRLAGADCCLYAAAVEDVHSLYGMSAKSNFSFGFNVGLIHGLVGALALPDMKLVQPKQWQKDLGLPSSKFLGDEMTLKAATASVAELLYPEAQLYGPKGGLQDGKADALMLAHWLSRQEI